MFRNSARIPGSVLALVLCGASPSLAAIDLVGATAATFRWEPAAGPVAGYIVHQLCESGGETLSRTVTTNQATLAPQPCSAFSVQVAAFGAGGTAQPGPLSEPSEVVRFLAAAPPPASDPGSGTDTDGSALTPLPRTFSDFDGDGRSDVLMQHAGDGSLQRWSLQSARLRFSANLPAFPPGARIVGAGDYDGDGFSDLLGLDRGQVFVWLLQDATLVGGSVLADDLGEDGSVEGSGDYDGDGVSDVLIRRPTQGRIEVWSMRGGEISAADTLAVDPGAEWRIIGSGDHDGDGLSDVLWQDAEGGQLVLWRSSGRGNFETRLLPAPLDGSWDSVSVADFDADGISDVLWRQRATGVVALSRFIASEIVETLRLEAADAAPSREIVGTGDFDANGRNDVLVRTIGRRGLRLWSFRGAARISRTLIASLPPDWSPVSFGDESPTGRRWDP